MQAAGFKYIETKAGTGPICPTGAHVTAHYHGTLSDGTVFDSSKERNEHFKFKVGNREVIQCWDAGITKMRKGGKATLICPPEYAYGASGYPGLIPQNSTLKFEVELHDFLPDHKL